jgi:hypothetical protein
VGRRGVKLVAKLKVLFSQNICTSFEMNWRQDKLMLTQTGNRLKNVNWGGSRPSSFKNVDVINIEISTHH